MCPSPARLAKSKETHLLGGVSCGTSLDTTGMDCKGSVSLVGGCTNTVNVFFRQSARTFSRHYNMAMFVAQTGGFCTTHLQGTTWRSRWGKGGDVKRQAKSKVVSVCRERIHRWAGRWGHWRTCGGQKGLSRTGRKGRFTGQGCQRQ